MLEPLLLAGGFALGLALAFATGGARFCIYGALSDVARRRSSPRLASWLIAIAVAILGTALLQGAGIIDTSRSLYASPRLLWLSHIAGGLLFGIGMTYAEGCGLRNLTKAGEGDLDAALALLAIGLAAFMTMKGILALPRLHGLDAFFVELPAPQTLDALLARAGLPRAAAPALAIALIIAVLFLLRTRANLSRETLWRGAAVGGLVFAVWWLSGVLGYLPEHPETLEEVFLRTGSGRMESLSFIGPLAQGLEWLLWWTDDSRVLPIGTAIAIGVISGAVLYARSHGMAMSPESRDPHRSRRHLLGGALMGMGGVTSLGCSVGQGITGISTLALGSILTITGIVAGALLALRQRPEAGCGA
ncbi:MAG TPA: YeeE/YedE thiosulfate transporter family protein [Noviherbaspirillum sp.]|nr:YeeE/YedE thiosulfate transporter family protein [Noviherbaspirillum sp.]